MDSKAMTASGKNENLKSHSGLRQQYTFWYAPCVLKIPHLSALDLLEGVKQMLLDLLE